MKFGSRYQRIFSAIIFALCMLLYSNLSSAQNFADPSFYLIDSLDLNKISEYDKELLDTSLTHYHSASQDTVKLLYVEHIVDNCWDPEIWPKYNTFLIDQVQKKLSNTNKPKLKDRLIYFLAGGVSNIGYLYDEEGDFLHALEYYHKALDLYERGNHADGAATTFNNLGVIYSIIGDTTRALEYHRKSLDGKKALGDLEGVAMSYNNIGTIYENLNSPFIALDYYESSLKIRKEIGDRRGIAISYDNIGDVYYREEVYGKAFDYYSKGHHIWVETDIQTGLTMSLNNLANVHTKLENFKLAKKYAEDSYQIADNLGYPVDIENASRTLIEVYRHEKNYKSALEFSDIYIKMRDKIRSNENAQEALKRSMQYEYQKVALKDSLEHQQQTEVQNLRIKEKETQAYALYGGIGLLVIALLFGVRGYQQKKKDNQKINEQKLEVESQKTEIEEQHVILANTHKEISDSISYAKRIQDAILPSIEHMKAVIDTGFVLYLPKDVVSGDFYWMVEKGDSIIFAVADCTGHGVPGAMVSVVCHNALDRVVGEYNITEPAKILDKTREIIIENFETEDEYVKDGMDISLCNFNKKTQQLMWAGANNPLYLIRASQSKELITITPDKQPIGRFEKAHDFTNHVIEISKGDTFYLFTDGYMDQFGGPNRKKFKYAPFKDILLNNFQKSMDDQAAILIHELEKWQGSEEQVDDICVVGIRV